MSGAAAERETDGVVEVRKATVADAARLVEEYQNPPNDWQVSPLDDPAVPEYWWWWLKTTWQKRRHTAVELHPLLVRLMEEKARREGERWAREFVTVTRVCEVLDARDPEALIRGWIGTVRPLSRKRPLGLPDRTCAWREGEQPCGRPVRAVNAKFCEMHASTSRRASIRQAVRHFRSNKSRPSPALANQGVDKGRDPHRSTSVFPRRSEA